MDRKELEDEYGQVWDTQQLQDDFDVLGFRAPYIACTRKSDKLKGSMQFQAYPRFYFKFIDESGRNDAMREAKRKREAGEKLNIGDVLGVRTKDDIEQWSKAFAKEHGL